MHLDLALLLSEAKGELRFYKNEVLKDGLYYSLGGETGSIRPAALHRHLAGGFYPPLQDYRTLFKKSCNLGFWGLPKIC